jgi:hypothetical protein
MVAMGRFPDASNQLAAAASASQPQPEPTVSDLGDAATKIIGELCEKVAGGLLPREEAVNLLVSIYELSPQVAESIVPEVLDTAVAANAPAPSFGGGFGGKPKGEASPKSEPEVAKVDSKEKP